MSHAIVCVMVCGAVVTGLAPAQAGWIARNPVSSPQARGYHGLAYDVARGTTVLFGGWNSNYLGDTWEWDGTNWMQRATPVAPSPRLAHAMAYDVARSRVVLFGGAVGSAAGVDDDETWEWDGASWVQLQPVAAPSPRRGANMAYDVLRGVCVLFGGGVGASGTPVLGDTWEWNGSTWTQRFSATQPPARWHCHLTADWVTGQTVLHGGGVGALGQLFADTWTWDGTTWQQLSPPAPPTARRYGAAAFDLQHQLTLRFGGLLPPATGDSSTWLWNGSEWRRDPRPGPSARWASAAAYDVARGRTVLFAGYAGTALQDTWEYQAAAFAASSAAGAGCAGGAGVPVLATLPPTAPVLGSTWTMRLGYGAGTGLAVLAIGFSDLTWLGNPLPLDLAALGMPGCSLHTSVEWTGALTVANGAATFSWALPSAAVFAGVRVFAQGLVLEAGANPLGAVMSDALSATLGPF